MFQWLYFIKLAAPLLKRGPAFYELYKKEIKEIKIINLYFYHFYVHILLSCDMGYCRKNDTLRSLKK